MERLRPWWNEKRHPLTAEAEAGGYVLAMRALLEKEQPDGGLRNR